MTASHSHNRRLGFQPFAHDHNSSCVAHALCPRGPGSGSLRPCIVRTRTSQATDWHGAAGHVRPCNPTHQDVDQAHRTRGHSPSAGPTTHCTPVRPSHARLPAPVARPSCPPQLPALSHQTTHRTPAYSEWCARRPPLHSHPVIQPPAMILGARRHRPIQHQRHGCLPRQRAPGTGTTGCS